MLADTRSRTKGPITRSKKCFLIPEKAEPKKPANKNRIHKKAVTKKPVKKNQKEPKRTKKNQKEQESPLLTHLIIINMDETYVRER